jgi:hypothetical protein
MIVQHPPTEPLKNFVAANVRFWSERLRQLPAGNGYVLVDLLHNNGSVLLLNLLLARYIAEFLHADVAAFVAPAFTNYPVPVEEVEQLARSFGVTHIVPIDFADGKRPEDTGSLVAKARNLMRQLSHRARLSGICRRLQKLEGAALRRELLGLRMAGIPVGDLVYDSYLDVSRRATIDALNDKLTETIGRALRFCDEFEHLLSTQDIRAVIASHTVYIDYGIPLRLALKHGRSAFGKVWLDPIGVRHYQRLEEAAEFAGMPVAPALDYFRQHLGPKLLERADEYFPPAPKKKMSLDYFRFGYGTDKTDYSKHELIALLGLDPAKKTCLIMAQQFTDAPHCYPDMIFDDYYDWLDQTLAFVATQGQVNWLLRQHPYEVLVGEAEFFDALARRHMGSGSCIKLVPNSVTTSSLFDCTDVVTTAIGSGGIEFASVGVPCILAGRPFYGDCDFAIRPRTREDYFATLAAVPSLGRLSERQIMAAKELALVFLSYKRVSSNRVPFITDLGGRTVTQEDLDRYWIDAAKLTETHRVEEDPLYLNVRQMIEEQHVTLLDFTIT